MFYRGKMKKISLITAAVLTSVGLLASPGNSNSTGWTDKVPQQSVDGQNVYHLNIQKEYLDYIKEGKKVAEGRLNVPSFADAKIGDLIYFYDDEGENATCSIISVGRYKTFHKMLVSDGVVSMLPQIDPHENTSDEMIDEGVSIYQSFPGYKVGVRIYGAISFGILYHPEGKDHSTANLIKVDDRNN